MQLVVLYLTLRKTAIIFGKILSNGVIFFSARHRYVYTKWSAISRSPMYKREKIPHQYYDQ